MISTSSIIRIFNTLLFATMTEILIFRLLIKINSSKIMYLLTSKSIIYFFDKTQLIKFSMIMKTLFESNFFLNFACFSDQFIKFFFDFFVFLLIDLISSSRLFFFSIFVFSHIFFYLWLIIWNISFSNVFFVCNNNNFLFFL